MSSSLIVDFLPSREAGYKAMGPSVRFSAEISIHFFQRQDDEAVLRDTHYSSGDYKEFKKRNRRAVQDVHRRYQLLQQSTRDGGDDADAFQECDLTGIENVLTPELVRKGIDRKRACVDAVLDEQDRQDARGCVDPERLARASLQYSRRAVQRSIKIGMMQELI